jgi:hypothetical protein
MGLRRRFGWRATHGNPWKAVEPRRDVGSTIEPLCRESLARSSWQIFRLLIIDESERSRNNFKWFALAAIPQRSSINAATIIAVESTR